MRLQEIRKRLPIVHALPQPDDRRLGPQRRGEIPRPRFAVWELTLACDHRCLHCGSRAGKARKHELTTQECLDVVEQLRELGVGEVALIGGEAYLRNDFILVIRAIRAAGMLCTMTTGARGLTTERIEAMREAGISSVSISIDGLAATHDRLRGVEGSHDNVFEVIARLRAAGIPVAANTQINRLCHHRALEMDRIGMRERIELVERAPGLPFDHGLYRIIREPSDEHAEGPVQIDEPRVSRLVERMGPGYVRSTPLGVTSES